MSNMRILVVSSCTKRKKEEKDKTSEMYLGKQHLFVKEGVAILRKDNDVDWYIISAKYGLINESDVIEPYDLSFNEMSKKEIRRVSTQLGIEEKLYSIIQNQSSEGRLVNLSKGKICHDQAFFILGEKYLSSIEDFLKNIPIPSVFFTTRTIPSAETIKCGIEEAKKYHLSVISLKGYLFVEYIKKEKIEVL
ncbi:MAG: hypothetical protein KAT49_04640 [Methanomicrobia archaeon]|nr:hypothetical protein [Methanomicrobia archaeon]